jgi:predicted nucleic acid-binding protein
MYDNGQRKNHRTRKNRTPKIRQPIPNPTRSHETLPKHKKNRRNPHQTRRTPSQKPNQTHHRRNHPLHQGGSQPLIVADSSYIAEGILSNKQNLKDQIITPQLAVYEVANVIWKQDCLLKKIDAGEAYLEHFYGLIESGKITVLYPNSNLMQESYRRAKENRIALYDSIFICLAIKLKLNFKTLDQKQEEVFHKLKNHL